MVTFLTGILSVIVALIFFVTVSSCQKQEGTMEKAGKKIDESVEAAKDTAAKAEEKVDAAKDTAVKAEEKVDAAQDTAAKAEEKVEAAKDTAVKAEERLMQLKILRQRRIKRSTKALIKLKRQCRIPPRKLKKRPRNEALRLKRWCHKLPYLEGVTICSEQF